METQEAANDTKPVTASRGADAACITRFRPGCKQLVFIYQGGAGRLQMPPNLFLWLSGARRRNMAMFRSRGLTYYHGAIAPDWPDIETTIEKQREIRDQCSDAKQLYCVGTSMGGYAAMLFGHYLQADLVHAFGPQTLVDLGKTKLEPGEIPEAHRDLSTLLSNWNGHTRYKVYYNEGFERDRLAAERLAACPGMELFPMPGDTHNVFKDNGRYAMLKNLFPPLKGGE